MNVTSTVNVPLGQSCLGTGENDTPLSFVSMSVGVLPLAEQWIIDVTSKDASINDLTDQIVAARNLHPEVATVGRLEVNFDRDGDPLLNRNVVYSSFGMEAAFRGEGTAFYPIMTTIVPSSLSDDDVNCSLTNWIQFKNFTTEGRAILQVKVDSTDEEARQALFAAKSLSAISSIFSSLPEPLGSKIVLVFNLTAAVVDATVLLGLFDPTRFSCKLVPNQATNEANPYETIKSNLEAQGFEVAVNIPSQAELESRG